MLLKTVIIVATLLVLLLLVYSGPVQAWIDIMHASEHIQNGTVFYCKASPQVTCTVREIDKLGYLQSKMTLQVTYSDNNTSELITTLKAFQKLWIHIN
jgi:hypothetical protein